MAITFRQHTHHNDSGGCGGIFFSILWTAFSGFFVYIGLSSFFADSQQSEWPSTPCQVEQFEIKSGAQLDPPFQPQVQFTYSWEDRKYGGSRVWPEKDGEEDYADLIDLIESHHRGELTHCYVNPEDPAEASLFPKSSSNWGGLVFASFGGLFMLIGVGIFISSVSGLGSKKRALSSSSNQESGGKLIMIPFFGVFACAGAAAFYFLSVTSWSTYLDARDWQPETATVLWSTVRSHSDSDGTTYSPDIFYQYSHAGRSYKSNTIGLDQGSSSGRRGKQALVDAHPAGKTVTCYVNPDNPHQALLDREFGWWAAWTLFPLPFLAVGFGGLFFTLKPNKKKARSSKATKLQQPTQNTSTLRGGFRREFSPTKGRIVWVFGALAIAAFWNGIVSVFLFQAVIPSIQSGNPEWFLILFLTPFVLIGIGMILHVFYRILACFNAAPKLTLEPAEIELGTPTQIKWKTLSGEQKLRHFAIYLVGEEEASYRRGTSTATDTSIFYEHALIDTQDPRQVRRGEATIELPETHVPSWESTNNAIKWSLRVRGDIPFWPDISDDYEITVTASKNDE